MHLFLDAPLLVKCKKCGKKIIPHAACRYCGFYKGKEVINVLSKLDRKERKKKEKELKAAEKEQQKSKTQAVPDRADGI